MLQLALWAALLAALGDPASAVLDRLAVSFPKTQHWFGQAADIRFREVGDTLVPDWTTITHPRVLRRDNAGQRLAVALPRRADGATEVALEGVPGLWVRTVPLDIRPVPAEVHAGLVVYPGAHGARDLLYKATPTHLDEYVVEPTPVPAHERSFRVVLGPEVSALRRTATGLEVIDRRGVSRLRLERPFARDAAGVRRDGTLELRGDVLTLHVDLRGLAFPVLVDPDWTTTGRMFKERFAIGAHRLADGVVVAAGGCHLSSCPRGLGVPSCSMVLELVERFLPDLGVWRQTAPMATTRFAYASEVLPSGHVLVAGGCTSSGCGTVTNLAEIFDPVAEQWRAAAPLSTARAFAGTAVLPGGDLLVVGGCDQAGCTSSVEIYEAAANRWRAARPLGTARGRATVTVLQDGRVLVAGGCDSIACTSVHDSLELYDPAADSWTPVARMSTPRAGHDATRLYDGDVLFTGGCPDTACATLRSVERWSPATNALRDEPPMLEPRHHHTATALADGSVVVIGGCMGTTCTDSSERRDLATAMWSPSGMLPNDPTFEFSAGQRAYHVSLTLADGRLMALGGCNHLTCVPTASVFPAPTPLPPPDGGVAGEGGAGSGTGGAGMGGGGGGSGVAGADGGAAGGAGFPNPAADGGAIGPDYSNLPPPLTGCACQTGAAPVPLGAAPLAVLLALALARRRR